MDLVVLIYRVSARFPKDEMFGLSFQVRKAAVAIPSNIAEGQGRQTTRDFLHFLGIARGSLNETETQMLVAERLQYLESQALTEVLNLAGEVGRLLHGLSRSLREKLDTDH
jgi:four helix bundle protein